MTCPAKARGHARARSGSEGLVHQIFCSRPDQLNRAFELERQDCDLPGNLDLIFPAERSADEHGMHSDILRVEPDRSRSSITCQTRQLRGDPKLKLAIRERRRCAQRFKGCVRRQPDRVFG